ncbi:glucose-6-phosphate isomerase [Nitratifractor sp.]
MVHYFFEEHPNYPIETKYIETARRRLIEERQKGISGYYDLPESSRGLYERLSELRQKPIVRDARTVVVLGVGGSSLGTKALERFLHPGRPDAKTTLFLENPDPVELSCTLPLIDPASSLFVLVSKSGSTIETLSIYRALLGHFDLDPSSDRERFFVITDEGSPLDAYAREIGLSHFSIPANVGGRFSVLSAVGIVPLTLAGYETAPLLDGAARIRDALFAGEAEHILSKAAFFSTYADRFPINVLFAYGSHLERIGDWYIQLWSESLGKRTPNGEHVGLTPVGLVGSVDQHSFLQLIMQGPLDKSVTFVKVRDFGKDLPIPDLPLPHLEGSAYATGHTLGELLNAECDATMQSLQSRGVPVDRIELDSYDAADAGELLMYYELLTSATGALLGVNTYDQPGVELGKRILRSMFGGKKG